MSDIKELKVEDIKTEADKSIKCPVRKSLYYITGFLSGPMCGKCFPCSMGSYEAKVRLTALVEGRGTASDTAALKEIAVRMLDGSMCKKGKDTAKFMLEWLESGVFEEHVARNCPDGECGSMLKYEIVPEACTMCNLCREACKFNAILGEKKKPYLGGYQPFEIRQRRCVKCGDCLKACPTGAVVIVGVASSQTVEV